MRGCISNMAIMGSCMDIEISNCNNIDYAKIKISENKLNIKFAPNGTGKSTISRAINFSAQNDVDKLSTLIPFKLRMSNPEGLSPSVSGAENISKIMCFDEAYVSQFTFQPDELVSNSFNIFIKNEAYIKTENEINEMVTSIRSEFSGNEELEQFISHLQRLSEAFKLSSKGISKASTGMKGLSGGNKLQHIPEGLEVYTPFITSQNNVEWIDWQSKGCEKFLSISDECCPFCSGEYQENREKIQKLSTEYDKSIIKNLVNIISVLEDLGGYFSPASLDLTKEITTLKGGLKKEHEEHIVNIKKQTDILLDKLNTLKSLDGFSFDEKKDVREQLESYKIDLNFLTHLQSEKTKETVKKINESLEPLIREAGKLRGKLNIQRQGMERLIEKHKKDINTFLSYAGYRYQVDISGTGQNCRLKLRHLDFDDYLSGGGQHLSYGERNAFALVLFMYECLSIKPDLIVLDDPISSFDKNKKFAILEMLFRKKTNECLNGMTVLMLTHDVEPIIDTIKSVRKVFNSQVFASYLRNNSGSITEIDISSHDISTFAKICKDVLNSDSDQVIKLIYLRRHCEILDDTGDSYEVLSNLFHCRNELLDSRKARVENKLQEMNNDDFESGCNDIRKSIPDFSYHESLSFLSDKNKIKELYKKSTIGYEKLQLFRVFEPEAENGVVRKFVNETYHIENEFICQLDPKKFDLIPEYIIKECDNLID